MTERSRNDSAVFYYGKAITILKKDSAGSVSLGNMLHSLGVLYATGGDYDNARKAMGEAKEIRGKYQKGAGSEYARSCNILGSICVEQGDYACAENNFFETKKVYETLLGRVNKSYAAVCNNLGMLFRIQGLYTRAEPYYMEAREIFSQLSGKESQAFANNSNSLGLLYLDKEEYSKAEQYFLECKKVREKLLGKKNELCADIYGNLALLYRKIGQLAKAEEYFASSRDIYRDVLGPEHPDYALSCSNLADVVADLGRTELAEELYLTALRIRGKLLGPAHPEYGKTCNNLAVLYMNSGRLERADSLLTIARKIILLSKGTEHVDYAENSFNLGTLCFSNHAYRQAEIYLKESRSIRERILGSDNLLVFESITALAGLYARTGEKDKAIHTYTEAYRVHQHVLNKIFSFTSETEQQQFSERFSFFFSAVQSAFVDQIIGSAASLLYDILLTSRYVVLQSSKNLRQTINASGDSALLAGYHDWIQARESFFSGNYRGSEERLSKERQLTERADELEKGLRRLSGSEKSFREDRSWKQVQDALNQDEAAVEFYEFRYLNGNTWTDSFYYAALILRKEDTSPTLVRLFEKRELTEILRYKGSNAGNVLLNTIYKPGTAPGKRKTIYGLIWKPLEEKLTGIKTIYFAPAGILHKIAFAAIPAGNSGFLSDKYQLIQLNTTADISSARRNLPGEVNVSIFGGIQYDADSASLILAVNNTNRLSGESRSFPEELKREAAPEFRYLAGTEKEAVGITQLAKSHKVHIQTRSGLNATEEAFKGLSGKNSPTILHIATHGFFFPDPQIKRYGETVGGIMVFRESDNPLVRAGLAMAGANIAWKGNPVSGLQDGILTAFEVSNMYLPKTQLAVLSACETGLGDIQGSEGVYGLQRAFKIAGVENLVMSLWKVPDAETAEFMQDFYANLFKGQSVSEAFHHTQDRMKKKYWNEPFKWAAWILIR